MTKLRIRAAAAAATLVPAVAGADIFLIANRDLAITPDEAREVYLGEKQLAGAVKLVPFDNSAAQAEFLSKVFTMDAGKYSTLWAKKGFREGLNPPAVRGSDAEIVAAVRSTPGGLGYVTAEPSGVKVLKKY